MKTTYMLWASIVVCLGLVCAAHSQGVSESNQVQELRRQVRALQENFERTQQDYRRQIELLQKQIELLGKNQALPAQPAVAPPAAPPPALDSNATNRPAQAAPGDLTKPWTPAAPITLLGSQRNYLNLSVDLLMAAGGSTASDVSSLELGGHDPQQNGFTLQNLETVLDGAVDPYFRAQANLIAQLDSSGASNFELEEAYAETTSLPWNLQVKAGQYLTEFGRINPTHPHSWAFVDQPLVNGRFFGPDGLRNPGARASWLMPFPFYSELFMGVQNSQGETSWSYRNPEDGEFVFGRPALQRGVGSFSDMLLAPRYAASFDLTDTHTILVGGSAAVGPNASADDTSTRIYGFDLTWKWKSSHHHAGFPFLAWQTEAMWRDYDAGAYPEAGLPAETLHDHGLYSQLVWGFTQGWVAGLRGDWVDGELMNFSPAPTREKRWRVSPNLTWYPTEYSKIRLQYNYDRRDNIGVDHSVWLQLEVLLGAHAAHKF